MPQLPLGLTGDQLGLFFLVLARAGGIIAVCPLLSGQMVPTTVRAGLSFLIALAAMSAVAPPPGGVPQAVLPYAALLVQGVVVGLAIGFVARLVFFAAELAGGLIDLQIGMSIGNTVDPIYGAPITLFGTWLNTLAALAFIAAGGIEVLIEALAVSYRHLPVDPSVAFGGGVGTVVAALGWAFTTALAVALPAMAVAFVLNLAIGLFGRAMPQFNVLQSVLPAQVLIGMAVLLLALPSVIGAFGGLPANTAEWIGRLWP